MHLRIDEGSPLERERDIASMLGFGRVALEEKEMRRHGVEIQPVTRNHLIRMHTYRDIQEQDL